MNYNLLYVLMEKVTAVTSGKGNAETVGIILWAGSQKKKILFFPVPHLSTCPVRLHITIHNVAPAIK